MLHILGEKVYGKKLMGKEKCISDNIKMKVGKTGVGYMNLLVLADDCIHHCISK
jgi:hypothetical protein